MNIRSVLPKEIHGRSGIVIVERTARGRISTFPVVDAHYAHDGCTHAVIRGGAIWCYDNTAKIEVVS